MIQKNIPKFLNSSKYQVVSKCKCSAKNVKVMIDWFSAFSLFSWCKEFSIVKLLFHGPPLHDFFCVFKVRKKIYWLANGNYLGSWLFSFSRLWQIQLQISESFSIWIKPPQEGVKFDLKINMLRGVICHIFFEIGNKVKNFLRLSHL